MPLLWLSIAFTSGILLAANFTLPITTWLILTGVSLVVASLRLIIKHLMLRHAGARRFTLPASLTPPLPLPILALVLTLGAARYQSSIPNINDPHFIAHYNDTGQTMIVTGVVVDFPDMRDTYTNLRIETERLHPADAVQATPVHGLLLARVTPEKEFHYGDRIVLRGQLLTPPEHEEFSYREYLARQGIYSYLSRNSVGVLETGQGNPVMRGIFALKERALETVYQLWPDPEASLFAGILLGVETGIPEPVKEAFKETGTSHVIAISGFNITIIAALFASFFGRILNPRRGAIAAALGIALYTILVGADAAVVRAAIMGGFSLFARQVGRRQHGINTLAFTAAMMSLQDPHVPWDVGFQLSFAATLGLVLYADPFAQAFVRQASRILPETTAKKLAGPIGEYILFTLAAQLTTLPVMAYHFGRISLSAFVTNPVILPVQAPIMIVGGLALILGVIWLPLGKIVAPLAWPFVLFTIRAVELFGKMRGGVLILGDIGILWVALFYALLFGLTFGWSRARGLITALKPIPVIAVLGILAIVTWRAALSAPDGRLHLTLLNVGTGDALLIQSPSGRYALIDGGPSASLLSDGLGRRLPPFHRELDWLVIASPAREQIDALPRLLERFPPDHVLWAGPDSPARAADYLRETLTEMEIPITLAESGHTLDLGDGATLRVLTAEKRGAILLIEWDCFRALLPLGAHEDDFESLRMGRDVGSVTALLLADNGYAPLNPPEWINNLNPQLVLLSVAPDDPSGLPDRQTLDALGGYSLLRTDQHGWIHISTDGEEMWIEVEK
ncbi:MAG: ComEC/Rec2 family competence protein [Anaerolineales bacterium]|nr:ComEC/Rec2 family competence protein [Anaerolineales bacterium]